jgi:hypothetical protein
MPGSGGLMRPLGPKPPIERAPGGVLRERPGSLGREPRDGAGRPLPLPLRPPESAPSSSFASRESLAIPHPPLCLSGTLPPQRGVAVGSSHRLVASARRIGSSHHSGHEQAHPRPIVPVDKPDGNIPGNNWGQQRCGSVNFGQSRSKAPVGGSCSAPARSAISSLAQSAATRSSDWSRAGILTCTTPPRPTSASCTCEPIAGHSGHEGAIDERGR